jgi:hypothetical protein
MAREYTFRAVMTFDFASHAELTSMRTTAQTFATAQGGSARIQTNEDEDNDVDYWGKLILDIPVTNRANASALMGTIDDALDSLPELTTTNGKKLKYSFEEIEVEEAEV